MLYNVMEKVAYALAIIFVAFALDNMILHHDMSKGAIQLLCAYGVVVVFAFRPHNQHEREGEHSHD